MTREARQGVDGLGQAWANGYRGMTTDLVDLSICSACGRALTASSPVCTECGAANPGVAVTPGTPRAAGQMRKLIDNPWVVLALLFLVTAGLGLPVLWISRGFSVASKIVVSVIVLVYTALVVWLFWLVMLWCVHRLKPVLPDWVLPGLQ